MQFFLRSSVPVLAVAWLVSTTPGWSQATQRMPGTCGAGASKSIAWVAGSKGLVRFPSYLEDSFSQLKKAVPSLQGLKFEAHEAIGDAGSSNGTYSDESAMILGQTGEAITAMLPRVPRLIAKEELSQAVVALPYVVNEARLGASLGGGRRGGGGATQGYSASERGLEGDELRRAMESMLSMDGHRTVFGYRIQSDPDPKFGYLLNEYRTNARNETVVISDGSMGSPQGVGFGNSWMMFQPENLKELRFRYLGRQKVGKHETFVVAFAQIPEQVPLPGRITIGGTTCRYYAQGVLWIDQTIFQIVRLQSDLLSPLPDIRLTQLRSELDFSEIRIPERNLSLWMPQNVMLSWATTEQAAMELHRYSNYRLFMATSHIVLP
jgi:hypothetical protein